MTKLSDKVIWITGASSGIGEQLVYQLAPKNNKIIISARRKEELERVKSNCPEEIQPNIHIVPLDLSDLGSLDPVADEALKIHGHIDVLFNNGGISQRSMVKDTLFEIDQRLMNVNFLSTVKLTKKVLPGMIRNSLGHIVLTSSLVGKFGTPFRSSYSASKHALHGFYEALAAESWENNVFVTLFCGGYIKTNISYNAVTGDGGKHNQLDDNQAKGKTAMQAAQAMIKAVEKNKPEIHYGGNEVMGIYLKRFFPSFLRRIVRKMKIKEAKKRS
jgi:short-subunit dehydrogenase